MTPYPLYTVVRADALAAAPGWFPSYFAGPASVALRASRRGLTVADLGGVVLEGWRVSETPATKTYDANAASTPIYRQSNIGHLRLVLSETHWTPPAVTERWCVQPGDVVVNKHMPVRAALISPASRRHPVDGNSLIVRGLPLPIATWLALCLNRPEYQQLLLMESGILRRVGLRALANLRLPPIPDLIRSLSVKVRDLLDDWVLTSEGLQRLKNEAAQLAVDLTDHYNLRFGARIAPQMVSSDNLLPAAVALRATQTELSERFSWSEVRSLAMPAHRARLVSIPDQFRILRLRDVGEDLFSAHVDELSHAHDAPRQRTLGQPLQAGDVLLSTQGTSFRALYVDKDVLPNTFPTDGLVRLRFHETPAAWALLLSTPQVRWQTARLAVGSVQQFVPPQDLLSIHVPVPERKTRERWQHAVDRHHAQRRLIERHWQSLEVELAHMFDDAHGYQSRSAQGNHEQLQ